MALSGCQWLRRVGGQSMGQADGPGPAGLARVKPREAATPAEAPRHSVGAASASGRRQRPSRGAWDSPSQAGSAPTGTSTGPLV